MVHQRYMQSAIRLLQAGPGLGFRVSLEMLGYDSLITRSRNTLVAKFLDTPDATHLLFVDADIAFEVAQVVRMLRFGEDVVAGMYPLIHWDAEAAARAEAGEALDTAPLRYVGVVCEIDSDGAEYEARDGFVTGRYAGTGFMLIRRGVFEKMIAAFPETRYRAAHTQPVPAASANQCALFDCMIEPESGDYLSEDYSFCRRWRGLGGRVWLDTQGALTHIGVHEFEGRVGER